MRKLIWLLITALILVPCEARAGGPSFSGDGSIIKAFGGTVDQGSVGTPTDGQVLTWSAASGSWRAAAGGGGSGVTSIAGTGNQITASAATGAVTLSLAPPILLTNGTAGAPTYAFSNDATTGMFYTPTHNLSFTVGGNESARILTTQDLAIVNHLVFGVAFPATKILGTTDGQLLLQNNAGTAFTSLQFGGTTSSFPSIKRNAAALNFRLADDSADALVTGNGYTIGTTGATPTAGVLNFGTGFGNINQIVGPSDNRLQISGGASQQLWLETTGTSYLIDTTTAASGTGPTLGFGNPGGTAGTTQAAILASWNAATTGGRLAFQTTNSGTQTATEAMRIDDVQAVWIGNGTSSATPANAVVKATASSAAGTAAASFSITGGAQPTTNATTAGGAVTLTGGACSGTTSTGAGGAVSIVGGLGGTTSGNGGNALVTGGGTGAGTTGQAGSGTLEAGISVDSAGNVLARPAVVCSAGVASTSVGGALTITAGGGGTAAGGLASIVGGAALSGTGSNQAAGGVTISSGASTGTAAGALLFKVPATTATGTGANAASTVLTVSNVGYVYAGLQNVADVSAISMTAGQGGSTSGAGGGFTAIAGAAGTAGGATGNVTITGGANAIASGSTAGGSMTLNAGACSGTTSTGAGGAWASSGGAGGTTSGTGGAWTGAGGNGTGSTSGAGGLATASGGNGSTSSNNNAAGGLTLSSGSSSGTANGTILVKVPQSKASGATVNTSSTVLTLSDAGFVYLGLQNVTTVGGVSLTAAQGGTTSGAGGNSSLIAGAAGTAGGACGAIIVTGGANAVASGSTAGGQVGITGGACSGTTSTGAGGALVFAGGAGGTTSGTGGAASFKGGAGSGSTSGVGGLTTVAGGAGSTSSSNNAGGGLLLTSGAPSGTGTADIHAQTGFTLASSATGQTLGDRLYIAGHSVTMSNTTATATTIVVLNVPTSNSGGGCQVIYQVVATDGTNFNTATGSFTVSCSNKAGVVTATTAAITDESSNANTGTLSAGSVTTTVASQAVSIKIAPAFTVIVPTSVITTVTIIPFGSAVTVTAQ